MAFIALCYIVLMPFMSALAPTEWTPLPLILLAMVTPLLLLRPSRASLSFVFRNDLPLWMMFALGGTGILVSSLPSGGKNLNYSLAVLVCYFFFFCMVRRLACERVLSWERIGRYSQWSLGVLSTAVLLEFYLASFHSTYFADFIHFAHPDLTAANFITADFKRPRAFSAEPGFTALAYEALWPITLLARRQRWWLHFLISVAFILLASAAAMACLVLAMVIVWMVRGRDFRSAYKFLLLMAAVLGAALSTEVGQDVAWTVFARKLDVGLVSISDAEDAKTLFDRLNSYEVTTALLSDNPLGIGWGSLAQAFANRLSVPGIGLLSGSGLLSLYLDIVVASGPLGLFFWLVFLGKRVRGAFASRDLQAPYVAIALLSVCLHHLFITEMQYPFLWFVLALADKLVLDATLRRTTSSLTVPRLPQTQQSITLRS